MTIENLEKEVQRLNRIIQAYEQLTSLTQQELIHADKVQQAQEHIQELARTEILSLRERIESLESEKNFEKKIKDILNEDAENETAILQELEAIRKESKSEFLVDLFRVLVNHEFGIDEAEKHWNQIQKHLRHMSQNLGRPISLRVAILDYFIHYNRLLRNPMIIEISIFDELLKNTLQDELTGIYNRRYFNRSLVRELNRAQRHDHLLSLFVFDLDNFKEYNDRFGHQAGDEALRVVGECLTSSFRREDIVCRYGGEEFVVLMPETGKDNASKVCRRFAAALKNAEGPKIPLTISGGISMFPDDAKEQVQLFLKADRCLYQAKLQGKDRILLAEKIHTKGNSTKN